MTQEKLSNYDEVLLDRLGNMLLPLHNLMIKASQLLNDFYKASEPLIITHKSDASPVTNADHACHRFMLEALQQLTPEIPILSEECTAKDFDHFRANPPLVYWLIDPLDGTAGFMKGTGEFAINLALIYKNSPLAGWVAWPQKGILSWALLYEQPLSGQVMFAQPEGQITCLEHVLRQERIEIPNKSLVVTSAGRGKPSGLVQAKLEPIAEYLCYYPLGAATKFCTLFAGQADFYPRLGPTGLWDLAAGHALLLARGGDIFTLEGERMMYQIEKNVLNPHFLAVADQNHLLIPQILTCLKAL